MDKIFPESLQTVTIFDYFCRNYLVLNMENEKRKIFVSYTRQDDEWALWIADTLKKQGHETIVKDLDFIPGDNFVLKMDAALRTSPVVVAVLSKAYFLHPIISNRYGLSRRVQFCQTNFARRQLMN